MVWFREGDNVEITGWPKPVFGTVSGNEKFDGVTHYRVIFDGCTSVGLLCHPDRLKLLPTLAGRKCPVPFEGAP